MTVIWAWVPMLDFDTLDAAEAMELELGGTHFWDIERRAAAAFATALGGEGQLVWDACLYYQAAVARPRSGAFGLGAPTRAGRLGRCLEVRLGPGPVGAPRPLRARTQPALERNIVFIAPKQVRHQGMRA